MCARYGIIKYMFAVPTSTGQNQFQIAAVESFLTKDYSESRFIGRITDQIATVHISGGTVLTCWFQLPCQCHNGNYYMLPYVTVFNFYYKARHGFFFQQNRYRVLVVNAYRTVPVQGYFLYNRMDLDIVNNRFALTVSLVKIY